MTPARRAATRGGPRGGGGGLACEPPWEQPDDRARGRGQGLRQPPAQHWPVGLSSVSSPLGDDGASPGREHLWKPRAVGPRGGGLHPGPAAAAVGEAALQLP